MRAENPQESSPSNTAPENASRSSDEVLNSQNGNQNDHAAPARAWSVGPYEIREQIGQGGMATVYRAWHTGLHRFEAIKIPRRGLDGVDTEYIQRLLSEARIAARLHHPHIVGIHNISEDGAPHPYFSMDLVEGCDLSQLLKERGALPLDETLAILKQAASAVTHAHKNGVVHRDIKPENILLERRENEDHIQQNSVKVVDFGISRAAEDLHGTRLTRNGVLVGTPEYMSPEQSGSGEVVAAPTDIYSLGILAYEMMTGGPPFTSGDGVSRMSVLISHVRDAPLAPHELNPKIPPQVGAVVLKALDKTPAERFASADEFYAALESAAREAGVPGVLQAAQGKRATLSPRASNYDTKRINAAPQNTRQKFNGGWPALALAAAMGVFIGWLLTVMVNRAEPLVADVTPTATPAAPLAGSTPDPTPSTPAPSTPVAKTIKRQTLRREILFPKETRKTDTLESGQRKILRAGQKGVQEVVLEITMQGPKELARRALSSRVLKPPTPQIESLGTRTRNIDDVPVRRASSSSSSSSSSTRRRVRRASSDDSSSSRAPRRRVRRASSSSKKRRSSVRRVASKAPRRTRKTSTRKSPPRRKPNRVLGTFRVP